MASRDTILRQRRARRLYKDDMLTEAGEREAEERYGDGPEPEEPDEMDPEPYEGGSLV